MQVDDPERQKQIGLINEKLQRDDNDAVEDSTCTPEQCAAAFDRVMARSTKQDMDQRKRPPPPTGPTATTLAYFRDNMMLAYASMTTEIGHVGRCVSARTEA